MGRGIHSHVSELTNHILIRDKQNVFKDVVTTLFYSVATSRCYIIGYSVLCLLSHLLLGVMWAEIAGWIVGGDCRVDCGRRLPGELWAGLMRKSDVFCAESFSV